MSRSSSPVLLRHKERAVLPGQLVDTRSCYYLFLDTNHPLLVFHAADHNARNSSGNDLMLLFCCQESGSKFLVAGKILKQMLKL